MSTVQDFSKSVDNVLPEAIPQETLLDMSTIVQGTRPNFQEIFKAAACKYEGEETGVLVCGPKGLQECVATECRAHNFGNWRTPFHFHSVSFDL